MNNFVGVECDFCAAGLWTKTGAAVTPEILSLSPALCLALRAWQAQFDESMWQLEHEPPRFGYALHEAIGRQIANLVRVERPDLHVVYGSDEPYPGDLSHR